MNDSTQANAAILHPAAWRNVWVLMLAGAITMSGAPIVISTAGLTGDYLLGADKSLATLPVTAFNIGVGLGAVPASLLMRRIGRRLGFLFGALLSIMGSLITGTAIIYGLFWVFAAGVFVVGLSYSFVIQYRFAVADAGDEAFKARAISYVMLGGVGAAIIGPQIVIYTVESLAPFMFAGSYFAISLLGALGMVILAFFTDIKKPEKQSAESAVQGRPLSQIMSQPRFIASTLCTISAASLMAFVMTAAPLAMVACGFSTRDASLGISLHVLAMYLPSFFTGTLINRYGKETIIAIGLGLLVICALVSLSGIELWQFWFGLVLLGLGWNFGFIGGTALVTTTYQPHEAGRVQGVFDLLVYGSSAVASLMAGIVLNFYGWNSVNLVVFPVVAMAFGMLWWLRVSQRKELAH